MHLAIDAVGAKYGGAAAVLQAVVNAALGAPHFKSVSVFCSPRGLRAFELPRDPRFTEIEVEGTDGNAAKRIHWFQRGLGLAVRRMGADALLCLSGGGKARGVPSATLIQQSLPFSSEARATFGWRGRARIDVIRWLMKSSCRHAAVVFVQTPTMKQWVGGAFGIPASRIDVVEPAPELPPVQDQGDPALDAMRTVPSDCRILYVGNTSAYKNLGVLPTAMESLRRRAPNATLFATVPRDHVLAASPGVVALGYLSDRALQEAYDLTTVLVMPSLVETVGLPMLEAASHGKPVIAADRPYAHDVCEEAALYFDPHQPAALAAQLELLLRDPALRRTLGARGRALVQKRASARPYARMIDRVSGLALGAKGAASGAPPEGMR